MKNNRQKSSCFESVLARFEREEEENERERCRATRVAGICCRYFQAQICENASYNFLSSFEENLLEEPQEEEEEEEEEEKTAQEQQEQQGSLRFMARALM